MGSNSSTNSMVIVAIPDENDRIWKISSENVPHLTLLFLGDADKVANPESIVQFVEHAASRTLCRFYLPVDHRGELGPDKADVLFFKKGRYDFKAVRDFRSLLLQNQNIKSAYDSTAQFEFPEHVGAAGQPWIPHLTLGYPATPAQEIASDQLPYIYDVQFNRIAVWMGNFDGPEFILKDYYDEIDNIDVPMDAPLAMASTNAARKALGLDSVMEHFGVKGMHWGQRKNQTITVGGKTQQVSARGARKADEQWKKDFEKQKGFGFDDHKFTKEYNAKFKGHDFSKEDWNNPSPAYQKYIDGYFHEMSGAYTKQLVEHFGSSPTGKMKVVTTKNSDEVKMVYNAKPAVSNTVRGAPGSGTSNFGHADEIKHADGDQVLATFKLIFDNNGLIKGVEPVGQDLAQTADLGVEFLEHHGVKGMRWGVRKDNTKGAVNVGGAAKTVGSGVKKVGRGVGKAAGGALNLAGDISFENQALDGRARQEVAKDAGKAFRKTDLPAIKSKPEHQAASKLKNRLRNPRDPGTKAYRKDVRESYIKRLETTANSKTNFSGTRQFTVRERGVELPAQGGPLPSSKYFWDISTRPIQHSDMAHANDVPFISIEVSLDADGWVTDVQPVPEPTLAQTSDLGAAFLAHVGVKGMRWGVRKGDPTAVAPTATSRVPHGNMRKTTIQTQGGQNHPASDDAIRVAQAHAKLKKSGTAALSNKELQDVQTRLNLERNVKQLTSSMTTVGKGRQFVKTLTGFGKDANDAANTGAQTARLVKQLA